MATKRAKMDEALNLDVRSTPKKVTPKPKDTKGAKEERPAAKPVGNASRPDRAGTRLVAAHLPEATHLSLRKLALTERRTTNELLTEFIEDGLAKYGVRPGE